MISSNVQFSLIPTQRNPTLKRGGGSFFLFLSRPTVRVPDPLSPMVTQCLHSFPTISIKAPASHSYLAPASSTAPLPRHRPWGSMVAAFPVRRQTLTSIALNPALCYIHIHIHSNHCYTITDQIIFQNKTFEI